MYLTAQHVVAPTTQTEGINAFHYVHGAFTWEGLPPDGIPDRNLGTLVHQSVVVPPPGNRVRSYLDIVALDETTWNEIRQSFTTFVSEAQLGPLPWVGIVGRTYFRIGMERSLAGGWQREIADLYRAAQSARVGG